MKETKWYVQNYHNGKNLTHMTKQWLLLSN